MKKRSIKLEVKGLIWTFKILNQKTVYKNHKDTFPDSKPRAVTDDNTLTVEFSRQDFNLSVVLHEMGHVFYSSCLMSDSNLKKDQVEENFCKILEFHWKDIGDKAAEVYEGLNG